MRIPGKIDVRVGKKCSSRGSPVGNIGGGAPNDIILEIEIEIAL
jgi:hypothetical protein